MAKPGLNPFGKDGVKSLNNYFLYTLTALVLALVLVVFILLLLGANTTSLISGAADSGALIVLSIICIAAVFLAFMEYCPSCSA